MKGKIRYIWKDEYGEEHITKQEPRDACCSMMGGVYTPDYHKVVLIEVEEDEDA